jgi:hypothetical protein
LGARFQQDESGFDVFSPSQGDILPAYIHSQNVHMAERVLLRAFLCHRPRNPAVHHHDRVQDLKSQYLYRPDQRQGPDIFVVSYAVETALPRFFPQALSEQIPKGHLFLDQYDEQLERVQSDAVSLFLIHCLFYFVLQLSRNARLPLAEVHQGLAATGDAAWATRLPRGAESSSYQQAFQPRQADHRGKQLLHLENQGAQEQRRQEVLQPHRISNASPYQHKHFHEP